MTFGAAGRLALVDELDAALEVEAELASACVERSTTARAGDQPEDDQQDEEVAAAVGHRRCCESRLLRRRRARAAARRRRRRRGRCRPTAFAGRSPSALTVTRLAELAHAPLEHGADVVVAALELQAEHLAHRAADHLLVGRGRSARASRGRSR